MAARIGLAIAAVAGVAAYSILARVYVDNDSVWYEALNEPAWQPPDIVFGIIWPLNFLALAAVGIFLAFKDTVARSVRWLVILAITVVLSTGWSYFFYDVRNLAVAAISLAAAALLTVALVVMAWQRHWLAGLVLLPYQIWLFLATSLSIGYLVLN